MELILAIAGVVAVVAIAGVILSRKSAPPAVESPAAPPTSRPARPAAGPAVYTPMGQPPPVAAPTAVPAPECLVALRLQRTLQLDPAVRSRLVTLLSQVAQPPASLPRLVSLDVLADAAPRELAELVMREPRLAAKLLGRANSAFYALQSPITSIPHAISYLGINAVRSLALGYLLEATFPSKDPAVRRYSERTWAAAMVAGELCALLAVRLRCHDPAALAMQAVLSFLGEIAVPVLAPDRADELGQFALPERLAHQQEWLGTSAIVLGSVLMQEWGLPESLVHDVEAAGRLIVTPVNPREGQHAAERALVYTCARIGEAIAGGRLVHAAQLDLAAADDPVLHYLQGYLRLPALARLPDLLASPDAAAMLDRMIAATVPFGTANESAAA
jgi:HD-like signal output (HDOD) protein